VVENPHHRVTSLRYRLITGPTLLEPLRVLAERVIDVHSWRVSIFALGASHAIRMERGDALVTELLTCAPPAGGDALLLDEPGYVENLFETEVGGFKCGVCLTPFSLEEGDDLEGGFGPAERLEVAYAAPPGSPTPVTRVGWRLRPGGFAVETVHTYPEEGRGVRSRSRFTLEAPW
jgi:hypothetical protein